MRPYLAVLKDSFREAIASRALLIMLILIVLGLILVAPFGLDTELSTQLRGSELKRPDRLLKSLTAAQDSENSPAGHLWSLLDDEDRQKLREQMNSEESNDNPFGPGSYGQFKRRVLTQLNKLLEHENFYHEAAWKKSILSDEAKELAAKQNLDDQELKRRNLLLLAAAFPRDIDIVESNAISLSYGTAVIVGPVPLTPSQFEPIFQQVLVGVVGFFLGFFGVFGCLLVTAGIVPRTFEPGEISLLLSKPVNRSLLFTVKFLGGCIFTFLCASLLVVGVWFLLGVRMGYWQHEILWCIPVYVFVFMIYFSVSALAGAIWRNAIVAVVLVVAFRIVLLILAAVDAGLHENLIRSRGIKEIVSTGSDILTIDGERNTYVWSEDTRSWNIVFQPSPQAMNPFMQRVLASGIRFAPVYDAKHDRILALEHAASRFSGVGAPQLVTGSADGDWERVPLGRLPEFTATVLVTEDGRVILPARRAVYEFKGQSEDERRRAEFLGNITGGLFGGSSNAFRNVHPSEMPDFGENMSSAIDAKVGTLLMFGNGKLVRFDAQKDSVYALGRSRDFETEESGVVSIAGGFAMMALGDGRIFVLDAETLETVQEMQLPEGVVPRTCTAAADNSRLAVLTHEQTVVVFDSADGTLKEWTGESTPVCSALSFDTAGRLLIADGRLAVHQYSDMQQSATSDQQWSESTSWVYGLYDYLIHPLWTILPQTAQLDELVKYAVSGNKTVMPNELAGPPGMFNRDSLQQDRKVFDPVPVLRDNAIFVFVMLALGCLYISRSDF